MRSILSDWLLALDPVRFAISGGYTLDMWQREVLDAKPRRLLLNCSRQTGKSFVASVLAVHQALYEPDSLVIVIAVAQRQAAEMIRVCRDVYANVGADVIGSVAESENKLSLELGNGSRILSVPSTEATIRGLSKVRLLILDEASRVPDALYAAVLPFLAVSGGDLALLSTPFGKRGFFYDSYLHRDEWLYREIPAEMCPRISPAFLAEQRRKMGRDLYAQEYECQFNDSVTGAFRSADIDAAVRDYPTWNLGQYRPHGDETPQEEEEGDTRWNLARYARR